MKTRPLLPGENAVLGLLTLHPMHGYDMVRYFREDLGDVCPVEQSLLYAYIRNLEERGYIEATEKRVGRRPPRKVYTLTNDGRQAAEAWLRTPVERMRDVRIELLVKLYVLHERDVAAEMELLAEQVEVCERYRSRLSAHAEGASGFEALVSRSKLSAAESTLRWLREYAWELEGASA